MRRIKTLRGFIALVVGCVLLLAETAVIGYNVYIIRQAESQARASSQASLDLVYKELELNLSRAEDFLLSSVLRDRENQDILNGSREIHRYVAEVKLKTLFEKNIVQYQRLDGILWYAAREEIVIPTVKNASSATAAEGLKRQAHQIVEEFQRKGQGSWFFYTVDEAQYLLRVLENQGVYVVGWVAADSILEDVSESFSQEAGKVLLCDSTGAMGNKGYEKISIRRGQEEIYLDNTRCRLYSPGRQEKIQVFLAVPQKGAAGFLERFGIQLFLVAGSTALLVWMIFFVLGRYFMKPLEQLTTAMRRISSGELGTELKEGGFEEFQIIDRSFNTMSREIKDLKIHVYEEKLEKQKVELQYLQLQINPHFLTNCVSMIRNLLIIEKYELAQRFSGLLSQYIRDNLTKETRVPLEREINNVVNYVELQKIRYEERLKLSLVYDESLDRVYIPSMMIQTFVENSVKHQISPEDILEIKVEVHREQEGLSVLVEDNGEGFKDEVLQKLREGEVIVRENVEHVGIHNIVERLRIMYEDQASIEFSNRECTGARVKIWLPGGV